MTHIWSLTNPFTKYIIRLDKALISVGRNTQSDIVCNNKIVSTSHANFLINSNNGLAYIQDNKSTNGTYVNNQKIQPFILHQIKDGDRISLGILNDDERIEQRNLQMLIFDVTHCKIKMNLTQNMIELLSDAEDDSNNSEDESGISNDNDSDVESGVINDTDMVSLTAESVDNDEE